jgi:hypothetical protein
MSAMELAAVQQMTLVKSLEHWNTLAIAGGRTGENAYPQQQAVHGTAWRKASSLVSLAGSLSECRWHHELLAVQLVNVSIRNISERLQMVLTSLLGVQARRVHTSGSKRWHCLAAGRLFDLAAGL